MSDKAIHILNSEWLIRMLEKSSTIPQQRLLNVFTILSDWLDAPFMSEFEVNLRPELDCRLIAFMSSEAAKAGVEMPEMLAHQLYFMALTAIQEKISVQNPLSLMHAHIAAKALIQAQTQLPRFGKQVAVYGIAASLLLGAILLMKGIFDHQQFDPVANMQEAKNIRPHQPFLQTAGLTVSTSPAQTAALFSRIEQMRKGDCQLMEALHLPEAYQSVYFENIVLGQISTDPKDQKLVHELLEMVKCNYKPMLMVNSR